jgi:hypothetical protein
MLQRLTPQVLQRLPSPASRASLSLCTSSALRPVRSWCVPGPADSALFVALGIYQNYYSNKTCVETSFFPVVYFFDTGLTPSPG